VTVAEPSTTASPAAAWGPHEGPSAPLIYALLAYVLKECMTHLASQRTLEEFIAMHEAQVQAEIYH
jgi:hypothetical protein